VGQPWSEILYNFVTLFAVVDPIGAAAAFATVAVGRSDREQAQIALRATIFGGCILLAFGFAGVALLGALGVSLPAFKIAGGLLLLRVGFNMLFAQQTPRHHAENDKSSPFPASDPSMFPLAVPIITGPGALAASITLVSRGHENRILSDLAFLVAAVAVLALAYLAMRGAQRVTNVLGTTGVDAAGRLVAIIVAGLAVQMIINGIFDLLPAKFH
jgi:multiple antibiotic resistance protein